MPVQSSTDTNDNPLTGNLVFFQNRIPPLATGSYTIDVRQTISGGKVIDETTYQSSSRFCVQGPQFTLPQSFISSYYPQNNAEGEYYNVLPHICLTRNTLPWERSFASVANTASAMSFDDVPPWLALLLLAQDEVAKVKIMQIKLLDLLSPEYEAPGGRKGTLPAKTLFPDFPGPDHNELEYGQTWDDPCLAMDVPKDIFNKIAPSADDLKWLGHVRQVQPTNSQSAQYLNKLKGLSTATVPPQLSTVITNRLPAPGTQSLACLVSMERWEEYLPQNDGTPCRILSPDDTAIDTVRLVLLFRWQFFTTAREETFTGYLTNLNKDDPPGFGNFLQLPVNGRSTPADTAINNAFDMGYVPIDHHTRQGSNTVSWYRGPFLPFNVCGSINIPVPGPDSATAYNPDTGMFDVSYAAAWQLGRLLALQNNNFAETLYNWKRQNMQSVISAFEEEIIRKSLGEIAADEDNTNGDYMPALQQLMAKSLGKILTGFIKNKKR